MSLDTFNACVEGYQDRLFDMQLLQVHGGFWSGYYMGSKKPKPLHVILKKIIKSRKTPKRKQEHVDTIDVEAFLQREREFQKRLSKVEE